MPKRINSIFLALILTLVVSCDSKAIFDEYKTLPNKWHKDSLVSFSFKAPDTTNSYNLYINLRNNTDYKYSNLFLITEFNYPNGKTFVDTLEYKMAAPNGALLGKGFTDVKENKLWYKGFETPFVFKELGDYKMNLQHAMRKNGDVIGIVDLDGITEIGFRVENK